MAKKYGTNISLVDKDDCFYLKIDKNFKLFDAKSGHSKLLASTGGFVTLEGVKGKKFEDKDIGVILTISIRDKKKAKKRADDDDD